MSGQLKLRHGTAAQTTAFTGARDLSSTGGTECTIDYENNRLIVHDGSTPGGHAQARLDEVSGAGFDALMRTWMTGLPTSPGASGTFWNNGGIPSLVP